jgi:hypothetical protein
MMQIVLTSFGQNLKVNAVYYDGQSIPYKIERKYFDKNDSSFLYVRLTNENSVFVRRKELKHQDTTIMQEEYGYISVAKTKLGKIAESNQQMYASSDNGDTVRITFYLDDVYIADTLLVGEAAKGNTDILFNIKAEKISLMLNDKILPTLDSLTKQEIVKVFYVSGRIVKIEWSDSKGIINTSNIYVYSDNLIVSNKYENSPDVAPKLFRADSAMLKKNGKEITWKTSRIDWDKSYITKYRLKRKKMQILKADSVYKEIHYFQSPDLFSQFLLSKTLYDDPLYSFELLQFERLKESKIRFGKGKFIKNKYRLDYKHRITEQRLFNKNKCLVELVTFEYK